MRRGRAHSAIGATLIGLGFLLTAPDAGVSQIVRSGLSADKPLSYHLSALHGNNFFSRHGGIWVRHEGMWAFRPTLHFDWQAYFRCQAGYGCGGLGRAPYRFGSWLPYGYAGWDLVPGGWMWFPGQRLSSSRAWDLFWDLWFFSPNQMFGTYGYGPQLRTPFAPVMWDGGRAAASGDHRPGQDTPHRPSIDPVLPTRPVETLFEPESIQTARQKNLTRPEINRRAFESTKPAVSRSRVTTGNDRTPSARSWPGATRPDSRNFRSAQPQSSSQSKSPGKKRVVPKQ